jgi:hypothetical protein
MWACLVNENGDGLDAYIVNIDIIGEGVRRLPCSRRGSSSEGSLASRVPFTRLLLTTKTSTRLFWHVDRSRAYSLCLAWSVEA